VRPSKKRVTKGTGILPQTYDNRKGGIGSELPVGDKKRGVGEGMLEHPSREENRGSRGNKEGTEKSRHSMDFKGGKGKTPRISSGKYRLRKGDV